MWKQKKIQENRNNKLEHVTVADTITLEMPTNETIDRVQPNIPPLLSFSGT